MTARLELETWYEAGPVPPGRRLSVVNLGAMAYREALELQRRVAASVITGEIADDVLLLVEHPPVVTLGRSSKGGHVVASPALLEARGVDLVDVERGGDVTYHGPGQLVGYPVIDLKRHKQDLHWYLRRLEEALIQALSAFGIAAARSAGYTGVWIEPESSAARKIASIGVHARDWVTWHGFALNVTTDLSYFDLIVPCGIAGVTMTSIARELGRAAVSMHEVEQRVAERVAGVFELQMVSTPPA
jgi:lipoyl(octanoyl) transferase